MRTYFLQSTRFWLWPIILKTLVITSQVYKEDPLTLSFALIGPRLPVLAHHWSSHQAHVTLWRYPRIDREPGEWFTNSTKIGNFSLLAASAWVLKKVHTISMRLAVTRLTDVTRSLLTIRVTPSRAPVTKMETLSRDVMSHEMIIKTLRAALWLRLWQVQVWATCDLSDICKSVSCFKSWDCTHYTLSPTCLSWSLWL